MPSSEWWMVVLWSTEVRGKRLKTSESHCGPTKASKAGNGCLHATSPCMKMPNCYRPWADGRDQTNLRNGKLDGIICWRDDPTQGLMKRQRKPICSTKVLEGSAIWLALGALSCGSAWAAGYLKERFLT